MAPRGKKAKTQKVEQEDVQNTIVKNIVINELPFSVVEDEGFKKHIEATYRGFQIPCHEIIARDCVQLFMNEKSKLKKLIKKTNQRVCLTLSTWTSNQSLKYLCISHFIQNNWELNKKIIGFSPLVSDNGEEIGRAVETCLHDWEISNVLAISTGSESSYGVAIDYLKSRFVNGVLDFKFLHIKCIIDFINDLVKHGLNLYPDSVVRVREAIRYVRESPARIASIKECSREHWKEYDRSGEFRDLAREYWMKSEIFLILDCPTRWTSTYEMLKASKTFEEALYLFEEKDPTYKHEMEETCGVPEYDDWKKVKKVKKFLMGFYKTSKNISELYLTSNKFLVEMGDIDFHLDSWGRSSVDSNMEKLFMIALNMKEKFYDHWGDVEKSNRFIYFANILDPRQKLEYIEFYFMNIFKHDY